MIVLKFGGTSVSTTSRIRTICEIVQKERSNNPVVVVSAIRGVTDLLLSCLTLSQKERKKVVAKIEQIHMELACEYFEVTEVLEIQTYLKNCMLQVETFLKKRERSRAISDAVISQGEKLSSYIISKALIISGIKAEQVVATELIVTDMHFGSADFLPKVTRDKTQEVLLPIIKKNTVPVITGFIGATTLGQITTLGRGGSDYSAAIIAYSLEASEIQIWTDVNGIYSADPRLVSTASLLSKVSYREAAELAAFGAKILHPRTIRPAITAGIPVKVLNTLQPESVGTQITMSSKKIQRVAAIASKKEIILVNLYSIDMLLSKGFLVRIFSIFTKYTISIDLVSVSEVSVSVTLDNDDNLSSAVAELEEFTTVSVRKVGMVSIIGDGIIGVPNIMADIFSVLGIENIPIHMVSFGATDINISLVVDSGNVYPSVQLLHDTLFLPEDTQQERSYL